MPDMQISTPIITIVNIPTILGFVIVIFFIFAIFTYKKHGRKIARTDSIIPATFNTFINAFGTIAAINAAGNTVISALVIFDL